MRLRNLHERARPFRYFGFGLLGVACLLLLTTGRALPQTLGGAGFCLIWPVLLDRFWQRLAARTTDVGKVTWALRVHLLECVLTAAVLTAVSLPPLAALAATLCLLGGITAQAGWRWLLAAVPALLAGVVAGWLVLRETGIPVTVTSTTAADFVSALLLLGFSLGLAELGFRQAQRLDRERQVLRRDSEAMERLIGRMQRYLPVSLRERLRRSPDQLWQWERRWLTVAFIDLVGFTELSERIEPEALIRVLDDYLAALAPSAERHGGELSMLLGDGVLVVFGLRGDDSRDEASGRGRPRQELVAGCVAFCREVRTLLANLSERWRAEGDLVELRMRAGIASGHATLGDRGGAERLEFTLIGGPVNLASRLQNHAPVDGVLLDAASAALASGRTALGASVRLSVKGLGELSAQPLDEPAEPDHASANMAAAAAPASP